ncbi:tetratricopeptide repeat protein [Thermosulfurimonas marina]|uniref:Tetratricopeptide repeat protein n=1 Tax=Thermosulfurimonas marina TaxID=2047767 RepID=A0A6H1WSI7_9BACT|nr:tetratricopeptide repeat protein [Thermosulfurimonas marina]QJA06119.1 tetratricopeptide repeat protein [Thermosulfurimonas marina]
MPEPRGWEIYLPHYLARAEEELQALRPDLCLRLLPEEGNLLLFDRIPATLRVEERRPLSEMRRWFPVLTSLARALIERTVLSLSLNGLPGPGLLGELLKEGPLSGLLLRGRGLKLPEGTLALTRGLYFLPDSLSLRQRFLREHWREGRSFRARALELAEEEDLKRAPWALKALSPLGLTYLGEKGARALSPVLEILPALKRLLRRGGPLTVLRVRQSPEGLSGIAAGEFFFTTERLPGGRGFCAGIYEGDFEGPPLALALAACEHARRAGGGVVRFEPFTYHVLGDLYLEWEDLGAARWAYEKGLSGTRQPADLLNSLGGVYRALGLRAEAREALEEALRLCPEDPLIHHNYGEILLEEGDPRALEHLRRAWELSRGRPLFAGTLARALAREGRRKEALGVLSSLPHLDRETQALYGELLYQEGRKEEALKVLKGLSYHRDCPAAVLARLAVIYFEKGEAEAARVLAREAVRRGGKAAREILEEVKGLWS